MEYNIWTNERGVLCAEIDGITLHSQRDPIKEARRVVQKLEADTDTAGFIVFGSGLGYYLQALSERFPESDIICLEPDAHWLNLAIDAEADPSRFCRQIMPMEQDWQPALSGYLRKNYQLLFLGAYRQLYPQQRHLLEQQISFHRDRTQVNTNTIKRFGRRWVGNLLMNRHIVTSSAGIASGLHAFAGVPALILAGGPSLEDILPRLADLRTRLLIIAVDTAYYRCRSAGAEPDFVVAVDPQYWNTKHIERPCLLPDDQQPAMLISEPSAHPRSFRLMANPRLLAKSLFPLGNYFEQGLNDRIPLGSGGSVATSAWDFARLLGSRKLYMAGLDMGFPQRKTHFKGSYFEQKMAFEGTRLKPAETASALYLYSGSLKYCPDFQGGTVASDRRMDVYCSWFEQQLNDRPEVHTKTLFPQGRNIDGMGVAALEEVSGLPQIREHINSVMSALRNHACKTMQTTAIDHRGEQQELNELRSYLARTGEVCSQALNILDSLSNLATVSPEHRTQALEALDGIDKKLLSEENRSIGGFLIHHVVNSLENEGEPKNLAQALERSQKLYQGLKESVDQHQDIIKAEEKRIKFSRRVSEN